MTLRAFATAGVLVVCASVGPTFAQDPAPVPAPTAQAPQGGLLVEPIKDHFVFAPEAKITEIDGGTAALVGGYGGLLFQESVLLGGGIYTMPNGPNDTTLTYGGLVVGFVLGDEHRISYGARGLVGVGTAELTDAVSFGVPSHPERPGPKAAGYWGSGTVVVHNVRYEETFMVFEPQADLNVRLGGDWRLTFGVGYRLTNASEYFDDRLHGVTGTVAIRFGGAR